MELHLYDTEAANPLAATIRNIDYDYQAEQWVIDTRASVATTQPAAWVVRWELIDGDGLRARWERPDGSREHPTITHRAERYTGTRAESVPA